VLDGDLGHFAAGDSDVCANKANEHHRYGRYSDIRLMKIKRVGIVPADLRQIV
jgi:hypothetical protein